MKPKGYHHVTRDTRCQIYALKSNGFSLRSIAHQLGFHVSTISREIKRNTGLRGYRYAQADQRACERRAGASTTPKKLNEALREKILQGLLNEWSPEQIAGRLRLDGIYVSHESIYRFIWKDKRSGGFLYMHLRHHGKRYNKRASKTAGRGCIPDRIDISERPALVENKARIGDWEGDTIIGARHKGAIVSYVDRHSKYTLLMKIPRKQAREVKRVTLEKMQKLPHPVHTITYDNGKEFAEHKAIASALNAVCYFATPYHSWERGLNEHTNGLVRQYLPKSTELSTVAHEVVQNIEDRLNHRPRKILNYKTPFEVFFQGLNPPGSVALHC
jgi:IS30 family transposase